MITKEQLVAMLETNDKAVARALVVLFERQTATEQNWEETREHNGVGFTATDGHIGTSMAKFYMARGYLTEKQTAYWRKKNKNGTMRIAKYWKQLLAAAEQKAKAMIARMEANAETASARELA